MACKKCEACGRRFITVTEEGRKNKAIGLSKANLGVPKTEEQRKKMSEARVGHVDADITKQRKAEARRMHVERVHNMMLQDSKLTFREAEQLLKNVDRI